MVRAWFGRYTYRRAILEGLALLAVVAVGVGLWQASGWLRYVRFAADARHAALARGGGVETRTVRFTFEGRVYRVDVHTDRAELAEASRLNTLGIFGGTRPLRAAFLRALVRSQLHSSTVTSLAEGLRTIRDRDRLDSDRFVELATAAVQSIPYGVVDSEIDLPAEVVANQRGVCTEKSFLLAAVLAHEGYDAGVWVFDSQHHVTAAVRGTGDGLFGTGYAVIETTERAYVGEVPSQCRGRGPVAFPPQFVAVSGGGRRYTADVETGVILATLDRATDASLQLAKYRRFVTTPAPGGATTRAGGRAEEYAKAAERQRAATAQARWIAAGVEDRVRTYRLLTQGGLR